MDNIYDLNYTQLVQKYKDSIKLFLQEQNPNLNANSIAKKITEYQYQYDIIEINEETTFELLKEAIESKFKMFFPGSDRVISYNYLEYINSSANNENKKKFWLLREWLLYQILHITSIVITNEKFFEKIFDNFDNNKINIFRDMNRTLKGYKLGIYGSKKITSDIDVGIYYDSNIDQNGIQYVPPENGGTAYIVSILENIFYIFLGVSSITLDIEFYADYTITRDSHGNEIFYIDTSTFTVHNFITILPILYAGIARNYIFAIQYINKLLQLQLQYDVNVLINLFTNKYVWDLNEKHNVAIAFKQFIGDILPKLDNSEEIIKAGFQLALDYTNIEETKKTVVYYTKSKDAEVALQNYLEKYIVNINNNKYDENTKNMELAKLIYLIGNALISREESYITPMTVMDVVYDGQKFRRSKTEYTKGFCDIQENKKFMYCLLGKFGYICSMMEQLGYLFRYFLIYSNNNSIKLNENQSTPKLNKYLIRFNDALSKYNSIAKKPNYTQPSSGGSRKIKITKKNKIRINKKYKKHNNKTRSKSISHF